MQRRNDTERCVGIGRWNVQHAVERIGILPSARGIRILLWACILRRSMPYGSTAGAGERKERPHQQARSYGAWSIAVALPYTHHPLRRDAQPLPGVRVRPLYRYLPSGW